MDSRLPEKVFREAVDVLKTAKAKITDDSDIAWISYNSPADLRGLIGNLIERIEQKELKAIEDACFLFLPTSTFQEHAISNGWSGEYMNLAERFDKVYELTKEYGKRS
ncbi:MAG TPA: hypothetical protein VGB46_00050 [Flavisolibacter sp.]|jgi:signal-transduction protein with cAMP-binding, CBS, and nucleotidyltransferase domain